MGCEQTFLSSRWTVSSKEFVLLFDFMINHLWDLSLFCIELCVTLCHLVAYFIFNSVLHCATLRDILYWTVCYTVPPCGTFCIGMCVTLCHRVGHFVWDCVLHCAWRSWIHVRNDILKHFANIFSVKVNMSKSKIIVFRKGRFFAASTSLGGMVMR